MSASAAAAGSSPVQCNREKLAPCLVDLKTQIYTLQRKCLAKTYKENYFCAVVKTPVNSPLHVSP